MQSLFSHAISLQLQVLLSFVWQHLVHELLGVGVTRKFTQKHGAVFLVVLAKFGLLLGLSVSGFKFWSV